MQRNSLLHGVFQFQPLVARPERLSALEKRMYRSPSSASSKGRTSDRKGERRQKGGMAAVSYGGYEGDD